MAVRKHLQRMNHVRKTFTGVFARYGTKPGDKGSRPQRTLVLEEIRDKRTGEVVADHLWFNLTQGFAALGELVPGDDVEFDARVKRYAKGYVDRRLGLDLRATDYKLSHPTRIVRRAAPLGNVDE